MIVHAANSAAALRDSGSHFDMVRCGIAIYGMDPFGADPLEVGLEPALALSSYVAEVKRCEAGQSAGYGRRFIAPEPTNIGVVPIGYGDGWRRGLLGQRTRSDRRRELSAGRNGEHGLDHRRPRRPRRRRERCAGEPAILIGRCGEHRITAEEVALRLATINYEITCGLTARVPRDYHRDGGAAGPASFA